MSSRRTVGALAAVAGLTIGVAACGADEADNSDGAEVTIDTFIFGPDPLEVDAGTTVMFTNEDDILHTVTQATRDEPAKGGFDLQLDGAGTSGDVTFDNPGTIRYTCTIHAGMDGSVIVRQGPSSTP